jgi:tetratricopeptide (TPR) repeat protein
MGIVYEGVDEKLERPVAIKCAKTGFRKRLPPEVRHATRIGHPNICKTFEIHEASTDHGEIDFLTMEFLEGETLTERLRRGPIPETEARTIARQLCAGLAEAHRNHIIHGDLKSNNVILTTAADGTPRAVITDFGLASRPETTTQTIQSGALGGTPDYMAPELWKGGKASEASDVYAFGVILYELASARRPFPFSDQATWEARLTHKPRPVNPKWDRILLRCLDPDPAGRFRDAQELEEALQPRSRRWILGAAAAIILAMVTGLVTYRSMVVPAETVRLAILPFETSAADKPLADGLLNQTEAQLRRVRSSRNRQLAVIPLDAAVQNKLDSPAKAVKLLSASHVLYGALRREGNRTFIHAYLTEARSPVPLNELQAPYQPNELPMVPVSIAAMVTGTLRLPPLATVANVNAAAFADFTRGIGLLQRNQTDQALPLLEDSVKADPESPLTHARLAEAQALKYRPTNDVTWLERAIVSLDNARRRNPDLAELWLVSGIINQYRGQYETAKKDLLRALDIERRNGDFWRRLGQVYEANNRFTDALAAYQTAIQVQPSYFKNYQALCDLLSSQPVRTDDCSCARSVGKLLRKGKRILRLGTV